MTDTKDSRKGIGDAIAKIPSGLFIITARYEDRRTGMLASWVQQVCFEPPIVSVAISKGRSIIPLLVESRHFGICQLPKGDKVLLRKFASSAGPDEDPFLGFELVADTRTGVPILANAMSYMECELAGHMDVGGDHDLFMGTVVAGALQGGEPAVHIRENGFKY